MTDTLEDTIVHYGVPGMKWGRRKKQEKAPDNVVLRKVCKNGTEITIIKDPLSKTDRKQLERKPDSQMSELIRSYHDFTFKNKEGKTVGAGTFRQSSPTQLELEWIGVDRKHRSNGYARAAMEGSIKYAKDNGITELKLTATPIGAPLYESLGFQKTKNKGVFGMQDYTLQVPLELKQADMDPKSWMEYIAEAIDAATDLEDDDMAQADDALEATLMHYGIPGMKWGRRKDKGSRNTPTNLRDTKRRKISVDAEGNFRNSRGTKLDDDAVAARAAQNKAKKSGTDALSNKELQALTQRMNLEQQLVRLTEGTKTEARKEAEKAVKQVAKQEGAKLSAKYGPVLAGIVSNAIVNKGAGGSRSSASTADPWAKSVRDAGKPWP